MKNLMPVMVYGAGGYPPACGMCGNCYWFDIRFDECSIVPDKHLVVDPITKVCERWIDEDLKFGIKETI